MLTESERGSQVSVDRVAEAFRAFRWYFAPMPEKKDGHDATVDILEQGRTTGFHFRLEIKHHGNASQYSRQGSIIRCSSSGLKSRYEEVWTNESDPTFLVFCHIPDHDPRQPGDHPLLWTFVSWLPNTEHEGPASVNFSLENTLDDVHGRDRIAFIVSRLPRKQGARWNLDAQLEMFRLSGDCLGAGAVLLAQNRTIDAAHELLRTEQQRSDDVHGLSIAGTIFLDQTFYPEAEKVFRKILNIPTASEGKRAEALFKASVAIRKQGHEGEALRLLEQIPETSAVIDYTFGVIHQRRSDWYKAVERFQSAHDRDETSEPKRLKQAAYDQTQMGAVFLDMGKYNEAEHLLKGAEATLTVFEERIAEKPSEDDLLLIRWVGHCKRYLGFACAYLADEETRLNQAEKFFSAARQRYERINFTVQIPPIALGEAITALKRHKSQTALDLLTDALRLATERNAPGYVAEMLVWRGKAERDLGLVRARQSLQEAIDCSPGDSNLKGITLAHYYTAAFFPVNDQETMLHIATAANLSRKLRFQDYPEIEERYSAMESRITDDIRKESERIASALFERVLGST